MPGAAGAPPCVHCVFRICQAGIEEEKTSGLYRADKKNATEEIRLKYLVTDRSVSQDIMLFMRSD